MEGAQPVLHPDFEIQRFPSTVRRYLGGLGPPFQADAWGPRGPGRLKQYILFSSSKWPPRLAPQLNAGPVPDIAPESQVGPGRCPAPGDGGGGEDAEGGARSGGPSKTGQTLGRIA